MVWKRLGAGADDDLAGIHANAAKPEQVDRDRLAQAARPGGVGRRSRQRAFRLLGQDGPHGARPHAVGKRARRPCASREVGDERSAVRNPVVRGGRNRTGMRRTFRAGRIGRLARRRGNSRSAAPSPRIRSAPRPVWRVRRRHVQLVRVVPLPLDGPHVALGNQLVVRALHRDEAHAQVLGERAFGRQLLVRRNGPALDVAANAAVQVLVAAHLAAPLELVCQHVRALSAGCHGLV